MEHYDITVISVPEDAAIANTLASSLRRYRLPRGVKPGSPELGYKNIYVDSTASPFDDAAQELLDHSAAIALICTPRAKSNTDILARCYYFKKIRKDEDVVVVLCEGEPSDSFPEFLTEQKLVQHIMPDMHIVERLEYIEPVASDLRGDTPAKRRHALSYETVRIVAAVLHLHPDDLINRQRRQRQRAILTAACIAGAACLAAAGVFVRLGLIAHREGQIAEQQTALAVEASDRLMTELPEQFSDTPEALAFINEAIQDARDALSSIAALSGEGK